MDTFSDSVHLSCGYYKAVYDLTEVRGHGQRIRNSKQSVTSSVLGSFSFRQRYDILQFSTAFRHTETFVCPFFCEKIIMKWNKIEKFHLVNRVCHDSMSIL